jgi:hypothetical protein
MTDETTRNQLLFAALVRAQAKMGGASKDGKNPHLKNAYPTLKSVIDACKEPLNSEGLFFLQEVSMEVSGRSCMCTTTIGHDSGHSMAFHTRLTWHKETLPNPQEEGSLFTYAKRYGLQSLLGIPSEDDDGNEASGAGKPPHDPTATWKAAIAEAASTERLTAIKDALSKSQTFTAAQKTELTKLINERSKQLEVKNG